MGSPLLNPSQASGLLLEFRTTGHLSQRLKYEREKEVFSGNDSREAPSPSAGDPGCQVSTQSELERAPNQPPAPRRGYSRSAVESAGSREGTCSAPAHPRWGTQDSRTEGGQIRERTGFPKGGCLGKGKYILTPPPHGKVWQGTLLQPNLPPSLPPRVPGQSTHPHLGGRRGQVRCN